MKNYKSLAIYFSLVTLLLLKNEKSFAQEESDVGKPQIITGIFGGSTQYRKIPGHLDFKYLGLTCEVFFGKHVSYSGSLYYGKGSDNHYYFHIPIAGTLLLVPLLIIDFVPLKEIPYILLFEDLHFNIYANDKVIISPTINVRGGEIGDAASSGWFAVESSGVGINVKVLLTKNWTLGSNLSYRYFTHLDKDIFGEGSDFGYSFGVNLVYAYYD